MLPVVVVFPLRRTLLLQTRACSGSGSQAKEQLVQQRQDRTFGVLYTLADEFQWFHCDPSPVVLLTINARETGQRQGI